METIEENIVEVTHNYAWDGRLDSIEYLLNGELVDIFYTLDSLLYTLEKDLKLKNVVVKYK